MTQRNDYDDHRSPAVAVGKPKAGPLADGWIDARPQPTAVSRWDGAPPALIQQAGPPAVIDVERVWTPAESVSEVGTPVHRALATAIRAAPLIVLLLPASLAAVWLLEVSAWWIIPLWGAAGIAAYLCVVWLDLVHNSPASTERHRINRAAALKGLELRQAHELRRSIVEAYLRHLDGKGGGS